MIKCLVNNNNKSSNNSRITFLGNFVVCLLLLLFHSIGTSEAASEEVTGTVIATSNITSNTNNTNNTNNNCNDDYSNDILLLLSSSSIVSSVSKTIQFITPTNHGWVLKAPVLPIVIVVWIGMEIIFYVLYCIYMIPRANQRTKPLPFINEDYNAIQTRHLIIHRVLVRLKQLAFHEYNCNHNSNNNSNNNNKNNKYNKKTLEEIQQQMAINFFYGWFHKPGMIPCNAPGVEIQPTTSALLQKNNINMNVDSSNNNSSNSVKADVCFNHQQSSGCSSTMATSSSVSSSETSSQDDELDCDDVELEVEVEEEDEQLEVMDAVDGGNDPSNSAVFLNSKEVEDNEQQWIPICYNDPTTTQSLTSPSSSSSSPWTIPDISKIDMDDFLSWGLFGKTYNEMNAEEIKELDVCHKTIYDEINLIFHPYPSSSSSTSSDSSLSSATGTANNKKNNTKTIVYRKPRRLTFENTNSLHRPFTWYIGIQILKLLGGILLRLVGFQRVVSIQTGLCGWYRPVPKPITKTNRMNSNQFPLSSSVSPILFFHGIAPGGLMLYLPMLCGMLWYESMYRPIFLFENPNIANTLFRYHALDEEETCKGIYEILCSSLDSNENNNEVVEQKKEKKCINSNEDDNRSGTEQPPSSSKNITKLCLIGHSFGSCQVSWVVHSKLFHDCIDSIVLLDPVSILLSDPDVMVNFLYNFDTSTVRMLASSELYTEHYLRRHFAWYNSELWLSEDIMHRTTRTSTSTNDDKNNNHDDRNNNDPVDTIQHHNQVQENREDCTKRTNQSNLKVLVALSENDVIVNAPKVKQHIDLVVESSNNAVNSSGGSSSSISTSNDVHVIYWINSDHADCVKQPSKWKDIREQLQYWKTKNCNSDNSDKIMAPTTANYIFVNNQNKLKQS